MAEPVAILTGTGTSLEAGNLPPKVRQSARRAAKMLGIADSKAERQIIHRMSRSPLEELGPVASTAA